MVLHLSVLCSSQSNATSERALWCRLSGTFIWKVNSFWSVSISLERGPVTQSTLSMLISVIFSYCCFFGELIFRRIMARRLSWINFIRTQNAGRTRLNHLLLCHGSTSKRSVVNNQPRSAAQSMSAVCTAASMCLCDWALILTAIFYSRNMGWHLAENSVDSSIF